MRWIIPRKCYCVLARVPQEAEFNSTKSLDSKIGGVANYISIQYDSELLSIVHAAHRQSGQKVSLGHSEKCYI